MWGIQSCNIIVITSKCRSLTTEETMFKKLVSTSNDVALTILRLVLGVVFFAHGAQKLLGWFGGYGLNAAGGAFTHIGRPRPLVYLLIATEFLSGLVLSL